MLPAGISTFQYKRTRTKNLAVPMQDLHPFAELFERIRHEKEQARVAGNNLACSSSCLQDAALKAIGFPFFIWTNLV